MRSKKKYGTGVAVAATAGALALIAVSATGASAEGELTNTPASANEISSTVRKTVAVTADSNGKVSNSIMVTQVSSNGKGQTTVNVPVGDKTSSIRNLDGFSGVPIQDGNAVFNMNLSGSQENRVMTSTTPGPIEVTTEATLDGQPIQPDEVVNKTGVLKVKYTIINTEKQVVEVPVKGEDGNTTVEEQEVDAPIGGSVAITLPQGFNEISAPGANIGGDGQGGSKLSYSLVMFKPLGNPVSTIEYESRVTNGTLPAAEFTMLPIIPMENGTIQSTYAAYVGGAASGEKIAEAGDTISDGAGQLAEGLAGTAVPGAQKIAAGAGQLSDGLSKLNSSVPALVDGVGQLDAGGEKLSSSLKKFQAAVSGITDTVTGSDEYKEQLELLTGAVQGLNAELGQIQTQSNNIGTALGAGPGSNLVAACAAAGGNPGTCQTNLTPYITTLATAQGTINAMLTTGIPSPPAPKPVPGANTIVALLGAALPGVVPGVLDEVTASLLGTTNCGAKDPESGKALKCITAGAGDLSDGLNKLAGKTPALADGVGKLASGGSQLADGTAKLATGLVPAAEGAAKLADGGKQLAAAGGETAATMGNNVAAIDAIQKLGLEGRGIPYGKASGENVNTTGAYQITLAAAKTPEENNAMRFGLAALGLIAAAGVGTAVARKKSAS